MLLVQDPAAGGLLPEEDISAVLPCLTRLKAINRTGLVMACSCTLIGSCVRTDERTPRGMCGRQLCPSSADRYCRFLGVSAPHGTGLSVEDVAPATEQLAESGRLLAPRGASQ